MKDNTEAMDNLIATIERSPEEAYINANQTIRGYAYGQSPEYLERSTGHEWPDPIDVGSVIRDYTFHVLERAGHPRGDKQVLECLVEEIENRLPDMRLCCGFGDKKNLTKGSETSLLDGILWADEMYSRYLGKLGKTGQEAAAKVRENALIRLEYFRHESSLPDEPEEPSPLWKCRPPKLWPRTGVLWRMWFEPSISPMKRSFLFWLGVVLWDDVVKPRLRSCGTAPSIVGADVTRKLAALTTSTSRVDRVDNNLVVLDRRGSFVAELGKNKGGALLPADMAYRTTKKLATRATIELWRWLLTRGWKQRHEGLRLYNVIKMTGGYRALARELGFTSNKAITVLKEAVLFISHINDLGRPLWDGRILDVGEWAKAPGRPAKLELTLLGPLRPGAVEEVYGERLPSRISKMLVPVPRLAPPLVGGRMTYASQMNMQQLVLVELRECADELVSEGSVQIRHDRWEDLAIDAGFSMRGLSRALDRVLEAWEGPFLVAKSDDRWDLAEDYEPERKMIIEGGKSQIGGKKAGQASAQRRRIIKRRPK